MSRFSPTVLPSSGQAFGQALQGTVDAYLQARRQRVQQDETMLGRGYRVKTAEDDQAATPSTGQVNAGIARGVQPITPAPLPSEQSYAMPGQGGAPSGGAGRGVPPELLSHALSLHVAGGGQLQSPQAAPPAPEQVSAMLAPQPHRSSLSLGGQDYVMTDQADAQMKMALALHAAQVGHLGAQTYKEQREASKLQLGDTNYAGAMGAVKGAEASAETPAMVTREALIAQAKLPLEIQKMIAQGHISLQTGLALGQQRGSIEAGLQGTRQAFEHGEHVDERGFKTTQDAAHLAGEQANRIAGIDYTQSGQIGPSIVREVKRELRGGAAAPVGRSPLPSATLPPLSQSQTDRAASDPAYKAFLVTKGYK